METSSFTGFSNFRRTRPEGLPRRPSVMKCLTILAGYQDASVSNGYPTGVYRVITR